MASSPSSSSRSHSIDETSSLLDGHSPRRYYSSDSSHSDDGLLDDQALERQLSSKSIEHEQNGIKWGYNSILLLGVFLVNADSSVLLAMFRHIASEFDEMRAAGWILTSYVTGMIVAQPLYGKLSDIYGRKPLLLFAYSCYCFGGLLSCTSNYFLTLVVGRTICGIGNAGITALISTLIVDMVPIKHVAVMRSYVYAVNQIGRALGPPIGGFLSDKADWRWALAIQVPLNLISLLVIGFKMPIPQTLDQEHHEYERPSFFTTFKRIDFTGTITLGCSNIALLLFFDKAVAIVAHQKATAAWTSLAFWVVFLILFLGVEAFLVREPILPLRLMTAAQMALYTSIPLYFKMSQNDSNTRSSIRLLFITAGTVLGGLISGYAIKKTGRYRLVTLLALVLSGASFLAIFMRWRGDTSWTETLYGFPIGLAFGVSLSAAFIGLTAGLEHCNVAIATSGFYLSLNLGSLVGVGVVSLIIESYVREALQLRLKWSRDRDGIIRDALSNLENIDYFSREIQAIVRGTYVEALVWVWLFALICAAVAFASTWIMKDRQMDSKGKGKQRAGRY